MPQKFDYAIIGAGPAGLACALHAKRKKLSYLLIDKGGIVDAISRFPAGMTFFSTPDLLEIGGVPFVSPTFRPKLEEVLAYYRKVAESNGLNLTARREAVALRRSGDAFELETVSPRYGTEKWFSAKIIIATGYYDNPNRLGVTGEDLPKVFHYFHSAHQYCGAEVIVVGGKNSAVETAIELQRAGAKVTLVHRKPQLHEYVKYWIRPEIDVLIRNRKIETRYQHRIARITPGEVELENIVDGKTSAIPNDFVFAMTGYGPSPAIFDICGVKYDSNTKPEYDPATLETNVSGVYVAGAAVNGGVSNDIFIENSRTHGELIMGK